MLTHTIIIIYIIIISMDGTYPVVDHVHGRGFVQIIYNITSQLIDVTRRDRPGLKFIQRSLARFRLGPGAVLNIITKHYKYSKYKE